MAIKFLPQHDESDCGAACLAMIARANGIKQSIASIRQMAGTNREGTTALGLMRAADKMGLASKAFRTTEKKLEPNIPTPFIAHVIKKGVHHFVVVKRVRANRVEILDPAVGRRLLPMEEFSQWWTGILLLIAPEPGRGLANEDDAKNPKLLPLIQPHAVTFLLVVIASALLFFLGLANFFYFRYLVDEILPSGQNLTLTVVSIGMIAVLAVQALVSALRTSFLNHIGSRINLGLSLAYLRHLIRLPIDYFESRKTGEVLSRFDDIGKIQAILSSSGLSILMDVVLMFAMGIFLFIQSPQLALVVLCTLPISVGLIILFTPLFGRGYMRLMQMSAKTHSILYERISAIFTVKAMVAEDLTFWHAESSFLDNANESLKMQGLSNLQVTLSGLVDGVSLTLIYWFGASQILSNNISLGQLISFQAMLAYFTGPVKRLVGVQPAILEAVMAARRLFEVFELKTEANLKEGNQLTRLTGAITFMDVKFQYNPRKYVLNNLSLEILPSQRVGIVGESGSGKSTLVKLLLRMYTPDEGSISLDGVDVRDLDTDWLRSRIGYVPQEVTLFSGTIRDNIAIHNPTATFEQVLAAARLSHAEGFINQLPDRFETIVGERGTSLSGGERQRIALARALIGRPEILVFDEATSALDTVTERSVQRTIDALKVQGVTTLIIAHRLSTIKDCDRILVLESGRLAESGSHQELLGFDGLYSRLWKESIGESTAV